MQPITSGGDRAETGRGSILVPVLCGLVQMLDGYDLSTIGLAVPSLVKAWGLPPAAFTQTFALSSIGIMVGAMVAGPVADRFGRRPMLLVSVLLFGVFSLISAWAPSLPVLVALRFLTGVGIGGAMPTTIALTADYIPQRWRATVIMFMFCGNTMGGFIAGQVAAATIPVYSWHGIFVVGGVVPLVLLPLLFWLLPESRHFQAGAAVEPGNPVSGLFKGGLAATTLLLWLIFLLNLLDMYLISYWLPTVLTLEGLQPADAAYSASMYAAGGVISTIALGVLLTRFRAEWVLACNIALGVTCVAIVATQHLAGLPLYAVLFGAGGGMVGSQLGLNGFAAAAYPVALRSTGVGWALGVGRLGGIFGPILGGLLLSLGFSPLSIMLFVCGPGSVTFVSLLVLERVRRGLTQEGRLASA
ncbi:MAG TPA: MFS transporter [Acetobacteraceae bacterium]|jgi:MFS transporter, AAHS family, 4-hydroxybenzoate transporter|nr:MFS transporter [Acetobacteraceae bacterium]